MVWGKERRGRARKVVRLMPMLLASTALVAPAYAIDITWNHGVSDDWFDGNNWNGGHVPTSGDDVAKADNTVTDINGGNAVAKDIAIFRGVLEIENGSLTLSGNTIVGAVKSLGVPAKIQLTQQVSRFDTGTLVIGQSGNNGLLIVNAGTVNAGTVTVGQTNGHGEVNILGGAHVNTGNVTIGADSTSEALVTINDVGSVWNAGTYDVASGLVEIQNGGTLSTGSASISGQDLTPKVTLDLASNWNVTGDLSVGGKVTLAAGQAITAVPGNGELDIDGTGANAVDVGGSLFIGSGKGSNGVVNLSGAQNTLTVDGAFVSVGLGGGDGTLYVVDHSTADFSGTAYMFVGYGAPGGSGIGADATGYVLVKGSSHLDTQSAFIGVNGTGDALVQSAAVWDADGALAVGGAYGFAPGGAGTLRVDDASLHSLSGSVGNNGGTGTVTVVNGGQWTDEGGMTIGGSFTIDNDQNPTISSGIGTLTVAAGSTVQNGADAVTGGLQVGVGDGSVGKLEVLDANSTYGNDGDITFGVVYGGTGSIEADGLNASVLLGGDIQIVGGNYAFSDLPGGTGPSTGSIDIANGAKLGTAGMLGAGYGALGTGSVTLSNHSQWIGESAVFGALAGTGTLDISGGSQATFDSNIRNATVGIGVGGIGTATVSGIDPVSHDASLLSTTGTLAVGGFFSFDAGNGDGSVESGTGTLTVSGGAQLESGQDDEDGGLPVIGVGNGAVGEVTIKGVFSSWAMTGDAMLVGGLGGAGTLNFEDHAIGSIAALTFVGGAPFSDEIEGGDQHATGVLKVSGGSTVDVGGLFVGAGNGTGNLDVSGAGTTLNVQGPLYAGFIDGDAHIAISQGAAVQSEDVVFGSDSGKADVTVTGGSQWDILGVLMLGGSPTDDLDPNSSATMLVSSGSVVTSTGTDLNIGLFNNVTSDVIGLGGTGKMTVTGAGSRWTSTADGTYIGLLGAGQLDVEDNATVETGGMVVVANTTNSSVKVTGGATLVNNASPQGYSAIVGFDGLAQVEVSGAGSRWIDHGGLLVGSIGFVNGPDMIFESLSGGLTIADGAAVTSEGFVTPDGSIDAVGRGILGSGAGGAEVTITGANSSWTSTADVFDIAGGAEGSGIVTIADNGTLAVKSLAIGTDGGSGTIAPDTTATVTVGGDLVQGAGSIYKVAIDPLASGVSSFIDVAGTTTIDNGAMFTLAPLKQLPTAGNRYTILTAGGGVNGAYANGSEFDTAFVDLGVTYDPNNVYLDVLQTRTFEDVALTPNQMATAWGLESLPADSVLYQAIFGQLTQDDARNAFDQLSGDGIASINGMLMQDSSLFRDQIVNRLGAAAGRTFSSQSTPMVMGYADNSTAATNAIGSAVTTPSELSSRSALWGNAFGSWREVDGDGNAGGVTDASGGLVVGLDGAITDTSRLGVVIGYGHSGFDIADRNTSGESTNYHVGVYGSTDMGPFALRGGLAYSAQDVDTARLVTVPGFTDTLSGSYGASTLQAFGELAYDFDAGALALEPFGNVAIVNQQTDAFTESGGASALHVAATNDTLTFTTMGIRASADLDMGGTPVSLKGMVGWRHAFGGATPITRSAFAGGDSFSIAGAPIAKDSAVVEAGMDLNLSPTTTLGLSYSGELSGHSSDQSLKGSFTLKF